MKTNLLTALTLCIFYLKSDEKYVLWQMFILHESQKSCLNVDISHDKKMIKSCFLLMFNLYEHQIID